MTLPLYRYCCCYLIIIIVFVSVSLVVPGEEEGEAVNCEEDVNILWYGNSYTDYNDVHEVLGAMLEESDPGACYHWTVNSPGGQQLKYWRGYRMNQHLERRPYWNYLILQEQSQVPGFWGGVSSLYETSFSSVRQMNNQLHSYNRARGHEGRGRTVLMLTWGRRGGDGRNAGLYPSYQAMQERITEGYERYLDETIRRNRPAIMAPVGLAFNMTYMHVAREQELAGEEVDPAVRDGNFFEELYHNDGSHPSRKGSYVLALVLYASITGNDPRDLTYVPDFNLEETDVTFYSDVAARTVDDYHDSIEFGEQIEYADVLVRIAFDRYTDETGWSIIDNATGRILGNPCDEPDCDPDNYPNGRGYPTGSFPWYRYTGRSTEWIVTLQTNARYTFRIEDSYGDGLSAPGRYTVLARNENPSAGATTILAEGMEFRHVEETEFILE